MSNIVIYDTLLTVSLALALPTAILLYVGLIKVFLAGKKISSLDSSIDTPPIEILVPIKGTNHNQQQALLSLIMQEYPCHQVTLIVESLSDPASEALDALCREFPRARKLVAGVSSSCAQKNHNLVHGLSNLKPETEIVVFCDGTNSAPPQWLMKFTERLRKREVEVVTTFRRFAPRPQSFPGVCQALYGAVVLLLASVVPKPWGGGTAILRATIEKIPLRETWSRTIVDDLTLGNILGKAGIPVYMDSRNLLHSPLLHHTFTAFANYMDRQIRFPKFTNHFIWGTLMVLYLNLTLAIPVAMREIAGLLLPGGTSDILQYTWAIFMVSMMGLAESTRRLVNPRISSWMWLISIVPLLGVGCFLFLRSIFSGSITWAGKMYWCGKGGVVIRMEDDAAV
jgi:hypothetical protein